MPRRARARVGAVLAGAAGGVATAVTIAAAVAWWSMPPAAAQAGAAPSATAPVAVGATGAAAVSAVTSAPTGGDAARIERGAYLARVGNCAGCHTAPGGRPYAGGRGIPTPFGIVFAGNLTPDAAAGIGRWTSDDFWRALHEGRSRDGRRLAPAFPYTSYTRVAREDSDAIFAFLRSVPAVAQKSRPHELRFPFGTQAALAAWQWLFFAPAPARTAAPASPAERGEYLVRGLGHCDACHAPRNRWGAPAATLTGGPIPAQGWYAPSLHPTPPAADPAQLVQLLHTGRNAHGSASGPMAGVVQQSTQYWTDADLAAAAAYLATLAPAPVSGPAPRAPADLMARGERLYVDRCADCHGRDGRGEPGAYPPLAGNPTVLAADARNLVQVLRWGVFGPVTATVPRPFGMPPQDLDDADTAVLLTYVRQSFGNRAGVVAPVDVLSARESAR